MFILKGSRTARRSNGLFSRRILFAKSGRAIGQSFEYEYRDAFQLAERP
jgi:hypothetical protein